MKLRARARLTGTRGAGLLRVATALSGALFIYVLSAYLIFPMVWTVHDDSRVVPVEAMLTRTAQGLPGDPLNIAVVAGHPALLAAMNAAGWYPADPVTLRSSLEIVGSVVLDRPYRNAPVSALYYDGRREDLAFEKPVGTSADRRQHVRFWQAPAPPAEQAPLWLGSATFDAGVGFSHYTGAVTHDIAPDIDAARDGLVADLEQTGLVARRYAIEGRGATMTGRNGEGDLYTTDGMAEVVVLTGSR